jgi:hypothetical protein
MDNKQASRKITSILKRAGVTMFGGGQWRTRVLGDNAYIFPGLYVRNAEQQNVFNLIEDQGYTIQFSQGDAYISIEQLSGK